MADTPQPRSYPQILGDMMDSFLSRQGINGLRVGSPIVSMLEAAAQSDMRNSQDIFNLLTSVDLDNATGLALQRIGDSERVPKLEVSPASGLVTITDTTFTKKSTRLFQGSPAPIVGSTTLHVVDASSWPNTGNLYVGRGTNNYEGPLAYTARTDVGTHWTITLTSGTTKFHNASENVILAQGGNRVIGPNAIVRTPQANVQNAIEFRTLFSTTLPDGEDNVTGVQVVAEVAGKIGNVIATAIKEFATSPFTGAAVTNAGPYVNGRETESDDEYRERIRSVRASRQLGTTLAIITAVTGITAPDENKRVNSANLVKRFGFPSTLYIDDGTGYEERTAPVAIESLTDDAIGGESYFETTQRPIARAFAITKNVAPFVLRTTDQLSVKIGGLTYTHVFRDDQFHSITNATAYEVVSSINSNPDIGFVARTAEGGTKVVVFANSDTNEDVEVIEATAGTDANDGLGLPAGINYTMRLYKNDRLLVKDGKSASVVSLPFAQWDSFTGGQSLILSVDHTDAITYTFIDQEFINANTGYTTVGRNSVAAWVKVINAKIPGITATENAGRIVLTSNLGPSARAGVSIENGSLLAVHLFSVTSDEGKERDYTLDRNEAQIVLTQILEAGDRLTAGSFATRAFIESDDFTTVTLGADANLWWIVDGGAELVQHGVAASTVLSFTVEKTEDWGNVFVIDSSPSNAFENVRADDWMVLWDTGAHASVRGVHRVVDASADTVTIERHTNLTMRAGHRSALIPGSGATIGKVLTCGGGFQRRQAIAVGSPPSGILRSAELYDHNTQTTTPTTPMNAARAFHTATTLANGKVVVIGGMSDTAHLTSIETYDPVTELWTTSGVVLSSGRKNHTATLLTDGRILVTGGDTGGGGITTYQIYSPVGDTITAPAAMGSARTRHRAVKLPSNQVLVAGGLNGASTAIATAELFTPGADTFAATGSMNAARAGFGMAPYAVAPTTVIAVGDRFGGAENDSYEIYSIGGGTWTGPTSTGDLRFEDKDIVRIANGHVIGLDGWSFADPTQQAGFNYSGAFTVITTQPASATDMGGPRWDSEYLEIKSGDGTTFKNTVASIGGNWSHSTDFGFPSTSVLNLYDAQGPGWSVPDAATDTTVTLTNVGLTFVRSNGRVQNTSIPAGANYTPNSIVDALNEDLDGATASVYKTTKVRVNTNSFGVDGDVALVTQDVEASALLFETGDAIENLTSHMGSAQTESSDLGTPSFEDVRVVSQEKGTSHPKPVVTSVAIDSDYTMIGLRNWYRGVNDLANTFHGQFTNKRANSNYQFRTRVSSFVNLGNSSVVDTRLAPGQVWGPWDRVYFAAPFSMSPNGTLEVVVDDDDDKHFSINMWRTLKTVGTTYASTNTFKDGDASNVTLVDTFGPAYDFNEMAVYMASRALAFSATAGKRMLFRYFRLGPDGDGVRVRFGNPDAPSTDLEIETEIDSSSNTNITVKLKSGAQRAVTVHNSTKIGFAATNITGGGTATILKVLNLVIGTAQRTTNVDTLTLTLPATITDHGLQIGDNIWVNSTDVNFSSGIKTITGRTATTIDYSESAANFGPVANIGTVSFDSQGEATYTGSSTAVLDYFRLNGVDDILFQRNMTFQVASVPAGGHHITVLSGDQLDGGSLSVATTLSWEPVEVDDNLQVFASSPQTATAIAAAINALRAADASTDPISAIITGTGATNITQNSPDENDNSQFWYTLSDGQNWVKTTTIGADYSLTFKNAITGALATNSDWANEVVRIVPITVTNVVEWLNTPTVTGLWTVAEIEESDDGSRVQISTLEPGSAGGIQVQGGTANTLIAPIVGTPRILSGRSISTISLLDGDAISKGMWVRIQNENPLPKLLNIGPGTILSSWGADGLMIFSAPVVSETVSPVQFQVNVERQGRFVAISDIGARTNVSLGLVKPGEWVRISAPSFASPNLPTASAANQGLFRVVRVSADQLDTSGTIWIENANAIEEQVECDLTVFSAFSPLPGDQLVILEPTWGADNMGVWDISKVGTTSASSSDDFANDDRFVVDVTSRTPVPVTSPAAALTTSGIIFLREGTPCFYVMKVRGITLNQDDGDFLDITWDKSIEAASISASAGSIMEVMDKLAFPTDFSSGADGYRYDTGLLREANKIVYGDPADSATYPGVAAADAHINIQGPLVKRIQVALSIRVKSGLNTQDIANRVRSAVATVINKSPIGEAIAFSDIVDAARDVVGVVSVTIVAPEYSVGHDQITVQPYEKPFVLDLTQDVQVSFVGV